MRCICKNLIGGNEYCPKHGINKNSKVSARTKLQSMGYKVLVNNGTTIIEPVVSLVSGKTFNKIIVAYSSREDDKQLINNFWKSVAGL